MFNIGPFELMVILVVALLVVGPKRLPEVARAIGRGLQEFRKAQSEVQETLRESLEEPVAPKATPVDDAAAADGDDAPSGGPSETADVARTLGRGLAEIRRARDEVQRTFRIDLNEPASGSRPATPDPRPEHEEPNRDSGPAAGSG